MNSWRPVSANRHNQEDGHEREEYWDFQFGLNSFLFFPKRIFESFKKRPVTLAQISL